MFCQGPPADYTSQRTVWCDVTSGEKKQADFAQRQAAAQHNEVIMTLPLVHFGAGPAVYFPLYSIASLTYLLGKHFLS